MRELIGFSLVPALCAAEDMMEKSDRDYCQQNSVQHLGEKSPITTSLVSRCARYSASTGAYRTPDYTVDGIPISGVGCS